MHKSQLLSTGSDCPAYSTGSSSATYDHDRYCNCTYVVIENCKVLSHISIRKIIIFLKKKKKKKVKYLFITRATKKRRIILFILDDTLRFFSPRPISQLFLTYTFYFREREFVVTLNSQGITVRRNCRYLGVSKVVERICIPRLNALSFPYPVHPSRTRSPLPPIYRIPGQEVEYDSN